MFTIFVQVYSYSCSILLLVTAVNLFFSLTFKSDFIKILYVENTIQVFRDALVVVEMNALQRGRYCLLLCVWGGILLRFYW